PQSRGAYASELLPRPPSKRRGRREYQVLWLAPAALCAMRKAHKLVTTGQPFHRHSLRDGFPAYLRALPGVHDLLVTVACGIVTRKLSTSPGVPGPHDFAVRSSRARRTRCQRPPHPASTFRDDRDTPLASRRDGRTMTLIWGSDKEKYFCERAGHRFAKFTC